MAISGDPDFILVVHGRFVGLELKARGEKPRRLQEFKLEEIKRCGGVRMVADPDNWDEIKTTLSEMDKSKEIAWKIQASK